MADGDEGSPERWTPAGGAGSARSGRDHWPRSSVLYPLLLAALVTGMLEARGATYCGSSPRRPRPRIPLISKPFHRHPHPGLMAGVPWTCRLRGLVVPVLIKIWPSTRLVHLLGAPFGCLRGPPIIDRDKTGNSCVPEGNRPFEVDTGR
ncbi:respiratory nitrate reductase subunit gamma [Nocardia aurantiaca]|uniref:NarG-like domain-containing protein n=1 Tax=Nocardia aurantiaca TaxID=2675850 RepID=A0A6I3L824_9NOCA|nr:hypothetical protein [Nocardia aurantiaca]